MPIQTLLFPNDEERNDDSNKNNKKQGEVKKDETTEAQLQKSINNENLNHTNNVEEPTKQDPTLPAPKIKRKPGRPKDSELNDYSKELIHDAYMGKRCEESHNCMLSLYALFVAILKTDRNGLMWISSPCDTFTSLGLFPDDKYKPEHMNWFIYKPYSATRSRSETYDKLGSRLNLVRKDSEGNTQQQIISLQITDILHRMLTSDEDSAIYFMDLKKEKAFIEGAAAIINKYPLDTDDVKAMRDHFPTIRDSLVNTPEKYDVVKCARFWHNFHKKIDEKENSAQFDQFADEGIEVFNMAKAMLHDLDVRAEKNKMPGPKAVVNDEPQTQKQNEKQNEEEIDNQDPRSL